MDGSQICGRLKLRQDALRDKFRIELEKQVLDNAASRAELLVRRAENQVAAGDDIRIWEFARFDLFIAPVQRYHRTRPAGQEQIATPRITDTPRDDSFAGMCGAGFGERAAKLERMWDSQKRATELSESKVGTQL